MKLSDIVEYVEPIKDDKVIEGEEYLLFCNYRKVEICTTGILHSMNTENNFAYRIKNKNEVNTKYLFYYLKLHMKLLKMMGNLSVDVINNIEIPELPNIEIQNKLVPFISTLYEMGITSIDSNIGQLFYENYIQFDCVIESCSEDCKNINDLFKITNEELFSKNVTKGKFQDPIEDYIQILAPAEIDEKFLVYFLYYIDTTPTDNISIPSISEQVSALKKIECKHYEIRNLKTERKGNKHKLRKLMDEVEV